MNCFLRSLTLIGLSVVIWLVSINSGLAAGIATLDNMFPPGGSYSNVAKEFEVSIQASRSKNLECTLYWSEVERWDGFWLKPTFTPMRQVGDIGERVEFGASISPPVGLYEYTIECADQVSGFKFWQPDGNGHLSVSKVSTVSRDRRALWLEKSIIAWNQAKGVQYELHSNPVGKLNTPIKAGTGIPLIPVGKISNGEYSQFPQSHGYDRLQIPTEFLSRVPEILKGAVEIAAYDRNGRLVDTTGVQIQGVLDNMYAYSGDLGILYQDNIPTLKLWAPTARSVAVHRFTDPNAISPIAVNPMQFDPSTGVWSLTGNERWDKQYYIYEVQVYMPTTGEIERNFTTDPYSVNLSQNSRRSQILDLAHDPALKPKGWDNLVKPPLAAPEDATIYEVHIRDFSRDDPLVALQHRGTFKAFTYDGNHNLPRSHSMRHLQNLATSGLTHIHLMPAFDFTSVDENPSARSDPSPELLSTFRRDSVEQQAKVGSNRGSDSFNWGYDPWHYGVPEGSYATAQDGIARILEFREMVQALSENGLRVVMDMVFNHTFANGRYTQSVLDKIVPDYYYRYTADGYQYSSSCCPDTGVEFAMMQKLMVDTLKLWATAYKIDGFRFDLMNLKTVEAMQAVQNTLRSLTLAKDGVDGSSIYIYGEGWDFGSAKEKGLHYANQYNLSGTGIGTFNDKIRDAIHGGFDSNLTQLRRQGFVNGQSYDWNGYFYPQRYRSDLRYSADLVRVGLAGSLREFNLVDQNDNQITGFDLNGVGYTTDPQESVNYISKHDNETLFDLNVLKLPMGSFGTAITSMADRVRVQNLAISLNGLSQGVPFFHMGVDLLRSKSLDRNSYDSGDWFNRVDFTYQRNNFGSGLPPAWDNESRWSEMVPLLADVTFDPTYDQILQSVSHLQEVLKIRRSSPLFRLQTADQIRDRLHFHNMGSKQKDALIVMTLTDSSRDKPRLDLDPNYEYLVLLANADKSPQQFTMPELRGLSFVLHPVEANSADPVVRTASFDQTSGEFSIPARTAVVFVLPQGKKDE